MAMAMRSLDRLMLSVHCGSAPTNDEWNRWLDLTRQRSGQQTRVLVETFSGGPNVLQRKALGEVVRGEDACCAVLTDSAIERAALTAIAWLGLSLRGFRIGGHTQAAGYLKLTPEELKLALEVLPGLRHECGLELSRMQTGS
jgi:hypothetical protein